MSVDTRLSRNYNSYMIKTLRESKAKLSELVELAGRGEDVLISVRGKVRARLTRAAAPVSETDRKRWLVRLKRLQRSCSVATSNPSVEEILAQQREDRI